MSADTKPGEDCGCLGVLLFLFCLAAAAWLGHLLALDNQGVRYRIEIHHVPAKESAP